MSRRIRPNTSENRERLRAQLARAREDGARLVWLTCEGGHTWRCEIDPRSEDKAGVAQPNCDRCGKFYTDRRVVRNNMNEAEECGTDCRTATKPECSCSCNGENHGVDGALAKQ